MICPSCKGENPARAVRCGHCELSWNFLMWAKLLIATTLGALDGGDKLKPSSESRPSSRLDRHDDRTIDSAAPQGFPKPGWTKGVDLEQDTFGVHSDG